MSFQVSMYVYRHMKKVHLKYEKYFSQKPDESQLKFMCSHLNCKRKFLTEELRKFHESWVHRPKPFTKLSQSTYNCQMCGEGYTSKQTLKMHLKKSHQSEEELTKKEGNVTQSICNQFRINCKVCNRSYTSIQNLK